MRDETGNAAQARLLQVLGQARLEELPGLYALRAEGGSASWYPVPADDPAAFRVFALRLDPASDSGGFVGWLHAHLMRTTGASAVVVADRWGWPAETADRVLAEIERLQERGRRPVRPHVGPRGGCLLCEAAKGIAGFPVVAEGTHVIGVLNEAGAAARGHCVFFPRRHVPRLDELEDAELAEMFALVTRVARALDVPHYNVLSNNGVRAGQTVLHAHAHLVPKPDAASGLIAQAGLAPVDQRGVADELRRRLGA